MYPTYLFRSLIFVFGICLLACQTETPNSSETPAAEEAEEKLGVIDIQVTGAAAAIPSFNRGLLLLHNFEYEDAREAFLEAQTLDSQFVMAYWGEAMTHNHPLWRQQAYEEGQAALAKLADSPEKRETMAATDLEKDFLQAVEILFGEGKKKERDQQYSDHLSKLYKKYPGNQEVAAFYALSCLGAVPVGRDVAAYEKGASIAQGVISANPQHPGALHYLIHSYDDPEHATLALDAANRYSKVAADAAHALHMPSHIYVAAGMWDEVVQCNIASWNASVQRMKDKELGGDARSYHALHWRLYGHLQKGQFDQAKTLIDEMNEYITPESNRNARSYHPWMRGNYLVETGNWESPCIEFETETEDLNIRSKAVLDYIAGMQAFLKKDQKQLAEILKEMANRRTKAKTLVSDTGTPMCSAAGSDRYAPNQTDINRAHIVEMELRALRHWQDATKAEDWLKQAVELENNTSYAYGPPIVIQPTHELYGKWLLENKRLPEAKAQFEKALARGPKRLQAMKGLLEVHQALEEQEAAQQVKVALQELLKDADPVVKTDLMTQGLLSSR